MVTRTKKMFVGGLSASTTIDDVKAYFESYGKVRSSVTDTGDFLITVLLSFHCVCVCCPLKQRAE